MRISECIKEVINMAVKKYLDFDGLKILASLLKDKFALKNHNHDDVYTKKGHKHEIADTNGLQGALDGKSPVGHKHNISDVNDLEATLNDKVAVGAGTKSAMVYSNIESNGNDAVMVRAETTSHDNSVCFRTNGEVELYDRKQQTPTWKADLNKVNEIPSIKTQLDGKAPKTHKHPVSDVDGLQNALNGKANSTHNHDIANVNGLQGALDGKANTAHNHAMTQVTGLQEALDSKAPSSSINAIDKKATDANNAAQAAKQEVQSHTLNPSQHTIPVTTTGDGAAYVVTQNDIKSLQVGMTLTIVPHVASTTTAPTLNVNNLGAKQIRQRLSSNTSMTTVGYSTSWLSANKPVRLMYDGVFWVTDSTRPDANAIYNKITVDKFDDSIGTIAIQRDEPTDAHVKLWVKPV